MYRLPIAPLPAIAASFPAPAISVAFHLAETARVDRRWPIVARTLVALRRRGRRSIRIVDVACGAGDLLLRAARRARELGFVAIEARGIDRDVDRVHCARMTARRLRDPAFGMEFEVGDARGALEAEREFPADVVLYDGSDPSLVPLAKTAGVTAIRSREPRVTRPFA